MQNSSYTMNEPNFYQQVYAIVRQIPPGKVTSYGRIAGMLGSPKAARAVGYALRALKDSQTDGDIPWHRVINSKGHISIINREHSAKEQAQRLRAEGVVVDDQLRLNLATYLWAGLSWLEVDDILAKLRE